MTTRREWLLSALAAVGGVAFSNGLAYFPYDLGSHGNGFVVLNTDKQSVVTDLPDGPALPRGWPRLVLYRPQFVYSPKDHGLYFCGQNVVVLDPQNRAIDPH